MIHFVHAETSTCVPVIRTSPLPSSGFGDATSQHARPFFSRAAARQETAPPLRLLVWLLAVVVVLGGAGGGV